jgi:spermidine synthase
VPPVLKKPEVTKLTIIEKHQDVRDIVEAPLRSFLGEASNRLEVITADIFDYAPPKGVKYDTLYFDIWPDICVDTLEEMTRLHRKFARRKTNSESYMESWRRQDLKYRASRGLW